MTVDIGRKLRQARQAKELSLEEISKELYIRVPYLQALEDGDFELIPTKVQMRGFLRTYASYLDLPAKDILQMLTANTDEPNQPPESADSPPPPVIETHSESETPAALREIGERLSHQRDVLGLSLDDIEAHTHIPAHYVAYLEAGEFERFPSPTQARGMLSNYAEFLDLDTSSLMLKYADALQARLSTRQNIPTTPEAKETNTRQSQVSQPTIPPWVRMFFSPDTFLIGITGIAVIAFIIWGIGRISRTQADLEPIPTAPSLIEALLPTATAAPTATTVAPGSPTLDVLDEINVEPEEEEPTAIPTIPVSGNSIQLFVVIRQRAYLRIVVDGETAFEGRALPDETYTFVGQQQIELLTGNAAAIQVYFNDQDLGTLGIFGEVSDIVFTLEGIITPTAQPTPTLSPEEQVTASPSSTAEPGDDNTNLPPAQNTPIP